MTTASQIITAINAEGTFYASNSNGSNGDGAVSAGAVIVTTTEGEENHSEGTITPSTGSHNAMDVVAVSAGENFNGLTVILSATLGSGEAGTESATYDPAINTLTVSIEDGVTTAHQVITAINAEGTFHASNADGDDGTGAVSAETFLNVTSGGSGQHAEGTVAPAAGDNHEIVLVAVIAGENFNDLTVEYDGSLGDGHAGNETATYDIENNTLTVIIEDAATTADQVIDAINAEGTFTASNSAGSDGTGTIGDESFSNVTSGGTGIHAKAKVTPSIGSNNEIDLVAAAAGENFNDLKVVYSGSLSAGQAGNESATYDAGTNTLTVEIEDDETTASQVVAAINADGTFHAINSDGSNGSGAVSAGFVTTVVASGTGEHAALTVTPATGGNNAIDLVAASGGRNFNGSTVFYRAGSFAAGNEIATYDPVTNVLTVDIEDGVTTANQIIAAIHTDGTFYASNAAGSTGAGAVSAEAFFDKNPLEINVGAVSALAGLKGVSLLEADYVAVTSVSTSVERVVADGSFTTITDHQSDMVTRNLSNGSIVLRTLDGSITITGGIGVHADGAGNILLEARDVDTAVPSDITLSAGVTSGSGSISVVAANHVVQGADIGTTTGSIDVRAIAGTATMDTGTSTTTTGGNIRYHAEGDVIVGPLDPAAGKVSLVSESGSATANGDANALIQAAALRIQAGLGIGGFGLNDPLDIAVHTLSAAAGYGGINLAELDDLTVDAVEVGVSRVTEIGTTPSEADIVDKSRSDLVTTGGEHRGGCRGRARFERRE